MTKTMHRPMPATAPAELAERGAESMRLGRFKDAIEAFKQLARLEPQPEWRQRLADAYAGRARALADKGMFKEAAIVLENTLMPEGIIREPALYLDCLIRQGQHQKAARTAVRYLRAAGETAETARVAELAAVISLAAPAPTEAARPGDNGWPEIVRTAQVALGAWAQNKPADQIEALLARIPLRSPFGPLRLILKGLIAPPDASEKACGLLRMIPADSVFAGFRAVAEAALTKDAAALLEQWNTFSAPQRKFVAEVRGLPAPMIELSQQMHDAEQRGPAALLTFLLRPGLPLPTDTVRAACLDLLPASPASIQQFERRFGPLSAFERSRALALADEAIGRFSRAQTHWETALASLADQPAAGTRLAQAVILRHLADLAQRHPEITARQGDDAAAEYLERSLDADPDHLPATLGLIEQYREADDPSAWHALAERAARRFPDNTQVLMLAVDAMVERDAYKKAVGFARRVLALDPINQPVRQRMIELQLAYARKQMRSGRADLAEKALAQAAEWERADAPSAPLRIGQALVSWRDQDQAAAAKLREAVELAGGGTVGWFRAVLEAALMGWSDHRRQKLHHELAVARKGMPDRQMILSLISTLGQKEVHKSKDVVTSILWRIDAWLLQGAELPWSGAEFQTLAACFHHLDAYETLRAYAAAALRREPDDCAAGFYRIVAQTKGEPGRLSDDQEEDLFDLIDQARAGQDFRMAGRIRHFLGERVPAVGDEALDDFTDEDMELLLDEVATSKSLVPEKEVRRMVSELGRARTIELLIELMGDSPMGDVLSGEQMAQFCAAIVARAFGRPQAARR